MPLLDITPQLTPRYQVRKVTEVMRLEAVNPCGSRHCGALTHSHRTLRELFNMAGSQTALLQILLVIIFGFVESCGGGDLRYDRLAVAAGIFPGGFLSFWRRFPFRGE